MHSFKSIVSSKSKIKELGGLDVGWLVKDDMTTTDTVKQNFFVLHFTDHNSKAGVAWQPKLETNKIESI